MLVQNYSIYIKLLQGTCNMQRKKTVACLFEVLCFKPEGSVFDT
jgi:hypothetical protein